MREATRRSGEAMRLSICALMLALAGCAVGPAYTPPTSTLDAGFVNAGATGTNAQVPGADIARFWRGFGSR